MNEGKEKVAVSEKAAGEIKRLVDMIRYNTDQLNAFLAGARAALDLGADWRFDVAAMAFRRPPTMPEPEETQGTPVNEEDL